MVTLEESIRSTMWKDIVSKLEREDVQEHCTAGNVAWYGDGGGDGKVSEKDEGI